MSIQPTEKELEVMQGKLDDLYEQIENEIGNSSMDIVHEIVELELQIEKECNK